MDATSPEYLTHRWQEWQRDNPTTADRFLDSLYDQLEWETFNRNNLARYGIDATASDRLRNILNLPPAVNLPAPARKRTPGPLPPLRPHWAHWSPEPIPEPTDEEAEEHAQRIANIPPGGLYHRGPICRTCDYHCDHGNHPTAKPAPAAVWDATR